MNYDKNPFNLDECNLVIHFFILGKITQNKPTVWHEANVISGLICYLKLAKIYIDKRTQVKNGMADMICKFKTHLNMKLFELDLSYPAATIFLTYH